MAAWQKSRALCHTFARASERAPRLAARDPDPLATRYSGRRARPLLGLETAGLSASPREVSARMSARDRRSSGAAPLELDRRSAADRGGAALSARAPAAAAAG